MDMAGRIKWPAMIGILVVALFIAGCAITAPPSSTAAAASGSECRWQVFFSPNVVTTLGDAKKTVRVQAYSFTSAPIAKALLDAKTRGVDVKIILDRSQVTAKYSSADFFQNQGMQPWIDYQHAIAHNKVMVIDDATVITGSFNYTKAAENKNAENLLIIHDPKLAQAYAKNWENHQAHSELYQGRGSSA
jgi:phosphatidylserine/phosphatidylglycerophosphate/cardiolipin synthase-like enzyme